MIAFTSGVPIPPSLLLFSVKIDAIERFAGEYGLPLMIRMDYQSRPPRKPVGGIPLYRVETIEKVAGSLIRQGFLPLLHPNYDRFKDEFSVGAILTRNSNLAEIEVVGRGFDAGDLRLGKAVAHETLQMDLATGSIRDARLIGQHSYQRERAARLGRIRQLYAYAALANRTGTLESDLSSLRFDPNVRTELEADLPLHYEQMPDAVLRELRGLVARIEASVIERLPASSSYVASLSYLTGHWILWDIYGHWYQR